MKVQEVCTAKVVSCSPESNLAAASSLMWAHDCGALPVVDEKAKVVGMVTDRDICIAVATKGRLARDIAVREVISGVVTFCFPDSDAKEALKSMQAAKVRRLPVVDRDGTLRGIVSINDLIRHAQSGNAKKKPALASEDVLRALKEISRRRNSA